jgi:5-oxopent-3-ene-1,2,5-tricarboxylate decarboxylase/2-hydroxyhepta-2,4-diene-1,7-dioate isomerase
MATGAFATAALRSRAIEYTAYRVADGHPDNAFIHAVLRIRPGRTTALKRTVGESVMGAMRDYLSPVFERSPVGLTLEIQEIDIENRFLADNLAEHLERRGAATQAEHAGDSKP